MAIVVGDLLSRVFRGSITERFKIAYRAIAVLFMFLLVLPVVNALIGFVRSIVAGVGMDSASAGEAVGSASVPVIFSGLAIWAAVSLYRGRRWAAWLLVPLALFAFAGSASNPSERAESSAPNRELSKVAVDTSQEAVAQLLAVEQRPLKFDWVTYSPQSGGFTVEFPTEPELGAAPGDGKVIDRIAQFVSTPNGDEGDVYMVIDEELVDAVEPDNDFFRGVTQGLMMKLDGHELLSSVPIEVQLGKAIDIITRGEDGMYYQGRIIVYGSHVYIAMVYNDQADRANYMKFLDSLRITQ